MSESDALKTSALQYSKQQSITIEKTLAYGNDGKVWSTTRNSAIKALYRQAGYKREIAAYRRLDQVGVTNLEGFSLPQLIGFDDSLLVIEMTIVFPPCILDFAKSYVDHPPDFSQEVLDDWQAETESLFGTKWGVVLSILGWLRSYGIYYFDAKPTNIRFSNDSP